ncbi:TBCC domain-containing protein 1-like isoform X2 [Tachypleus tridentatus]|uniref:TBCC domain-containing protein 1-like isoform X2 n=1 Tax=Tachypleus tridentatus TaxID=6853 RepID=UPI003FD6401E
MEPQKTESIRLWVRSEPFELGTLPLSPHSKLIPKYLKRIVPYAKGQGESGFPELSYSVWRHIACNKLQLTEDLAWLYFEQYNLVHLKKAPERIELDKMKLGYSGELADLTRKTQSVDLLRFVLLLFVQHIHKVNLCTSSTSSLWEDRWPVETKRDLSPIMSEEQKQLNFVWSRLEEMIEILQDNCDDIGVEGEVVDALGLVIEGSSGFDNSVVPLKGLTSQNENHAAAGYLKATQSYCFKKLTNWIKVHLVSNPFGVQYCLTQGRRLSLLGQDKRTREDKIISPKSSFMATNVHLNVGSKKLVILSEICKRTLAQNSKTLHGSTLKLYRCHYCYLYLFPPFRAVTVNNCKGTTLVLGPVATTLHITNSKKLDCHSC